MKREPYAADRHLSTWEEAAAKLDPGDQFCSSPYWCVPFVQAFRSDSDIVVYQNSQDLGVFTEENLRDGVHYLPAETMWMFGTPVLSVHPSVFLREFCAFSRRGQKGVRIVSLTGIYRESELLKDDFWRKYPHWEHPAIVRRVADLEGGVDGFLGRRSKNFRSRLRRTIKKANSEQIITEFMPHRADPPTAQALLKRVMNLEAQSWKGIAGMGVDRGEMARFYKAMIPMLAQSGRLRGLFLKRGDQDLAYLLGATFGATFRGLQFSFLEQEQQGLGNVAQFFMIEAMVEEGFRFYDFGQDMSYKARWAELEVTSHGFGFQFG